MPFTPGVTTSETGGLLFVISGQSLCVVTGPTPAVPSGDAGDSIYLGDLDGHPCFGCLLGAGPPPAGSEPVPMRQLYGALGDEEFAIATRALGLTTWDQDFRYCGRCGAPTERSMVERMRVCTSCKFPSYPRLSPAVIVLVERDGKCLLARNARTRMPFYSTLAGFVEVGETLEHCVAREIREEASIELTDLRYFGSQPWPFTNSLMIGFTAKWASGEIVADPTEIFDADWFAPDAIPVVPPKLSIAGQLIEDFVRRHSKP